MRYKGIWIGIIIVLTVTIFNVLNYWNIKQVFRTLKEEKLYIAEKNNQKTDAIKAEAIYGYVAGYLNSTNPSLMTQEIPDFVYLTVEYAREFKINPYQCLTICQIEDGFDLHKVGSHGEQGPAQLMPDTWKIYYKSLGYRPSDFYKWQCNYRVAMAHFSELLKQNHDHVEMAIGEYNGGGGWSNIESSRIYVQRFKLANRGISKLREAKKDFDGTF